MLDQNLLTQFIDQSKVSRDSRYEAFNNIIYSQLLVFERLQMFYILNHVWIPPENGPYGTKMP